MKRFVIVAGAVVMSFTAVLSGGGADASESSDYRVGEARAQVIPDQTESTAVPTPQAAVLSPYEAMDPADDAPEATDIWEYRVLHGKKRVQLEVGINLPINPKKDRNWRHGLSFLEWDISIDGDEEPEFFTLLFNDGNKNMVSIVDKTKRPKPPAVCAAEYRRFDSYMYIVSFRRSCIDRPETIRVSAILYRDRNPLLSPGPEDAADLAPDPSGTNQVYTPEVARNLPG